MLQAISITLREGFEAALVIGIMLTYALRTGRSELRRPIALGTLAAIGLSIVAAFGLGAAGVEAENEAAEGIMYLVASGFVVSMVVWMWRAGANVREVVVSGVDRAVSRSTAASWAVASLAFFMVAREGVETVLFMSANALDQGLLATLVGGAIGLALAFGLGAGVYYGAAHIDLRLFFAATSIALLLLASRFLGLGLLELGEAGVTLLPEALEEGLELLEEGALATVLSVTVVALPLGAVGWSLLRRRLIAPTA